MTKRFLFCIILRPIDVRYFLLQVQGIAKSHWFKTEIFLPTKMGLIKFATLAVDLLLQYLMYQLFLHSFVSFFICSEQGLNSFAIELIFQSKMRANLKKLVKPPISV